jgi:hypothetical protein
MAGVKVIIGVILAIASAPAAAQDTPSIDFNGALDHARTTGRMVRQAQRREAATRATPAQADACARKAEFRAKSPSDEAKLRKLYALCRSVGL